MLRTKTELTCQGAKKNFKCLDTRKSRFGSGSDVDFGRRGDLGSRAVTLAVLSNSTSLEPKKMKCH